MAQRRSGQALAQTINRLYSMTEASMRIEPRSVLVAESSAVAVWVDLCGSIPMTIMGFGSLFARWMGDPRWTIRLQVPLTAACGHASLESHRERRPEGVTHQTRVIPTAGDRMFTSHSFRPATTRYELRFPPDSGGWLRGQKLRGQ